jgi:hypothetical protein
MKRRPFRLFLTLFALFFFASCSGENSEKSGDQLAAALSSVSIDSDVSGENTCLLAYAKNYDQIVSEAEILSLTGFSKEVMETNYQKFLKDPAFHAMQYKFKNKRMGKLGSLKGEYELPDVVEITGIKASTLERFKKSYSAMTDEDRKLVEQQMSNAIDGKSKNKQANEAGEKLEKANVDKETAKTIGSGIMSKFQEISQHYQEVSGLGDAASWNAMTNDIVVWKKGAEFQVKVEVSSEEEVNKALALKIAKLVLEKCD